MRKRQGSVLLQKVVDLYWAIRHKIMLCRKEIQDQLENPEGGHRVKGEVKEPDFTSWVK